MKMNLLKVDTLAQVDEKLARYFGGRVRTTERVPLSCAVGRVLSEDVVSDEDMPPFPRSVVDGYAVKGADTFGVSDAVPVLLKPVGESRMGEACEIAVGAGEAAYVPTGGMLPAGTDAMVMIEYTERFSADEIAVYRPSAPGSGVMGRGEDFPAGRVMLREGERIGAKAIGLLACLGKTQVSVYQKPKVALISTGDELIEADRAPRIGQIRDVNSHLLTAFLDKIGAEVTENALVGDAFEDLQATAIRAAAAADVVLISGGSSQGNRDMTGEVIASLGAPGIFTRGLALKPGKPAILSALGEGEHAKLIAGLPGHPMSAIVTYMAVVEPFIRTYLLNETASALCASARLTENIRGGEGRETWQPVKLRLLPSGEREAEPIYAKSGSIYQLAQADGFVRIPLASEGLAKGTAVEVSLIPH